MKSEFLKNIYIIKTIDGEGVYLCTLDNIYLVGRGVFKKVNTDEFEVRGFFKKVNTDEFDILLKRYSQIEEQVIKIKCPENLKNIGIEKIKDALDTNLIIFANKAVLSIYPVFDPETNECNMTIWFDKPEDYHEFITEDENIEEYPDLKPHVDDHP